MKSKNNSSPVRCLFFHGFPHDPFMDWGDQLYAAATQQDLSIDFHLAYSISASPPIYKKWGQRFPRRPLKDICSLLEIKRARPWLKVHPLKLKNYALRRANEEILAGISRRPLKGFFLSVYHSLCDVLDDEAIGWKDVSPDEIIPLFQEADRFEQAVISLLDELMPDAVIALEDMNFYQGELLRVICKEKNITWKGFSGVPLLHRARLYSDLSEAVTHFPGRWNKTTERDSYSTAEGEKILSGFTEDMISLIQHHTDFGFQPRSDKKTVLLALSSSFERYSHHFESVFDNQTMLVDKMAAWAVSKEDFQLIVRPHPLEHLPFLTRIRRVLDSYPSVIFCEGAEFDTYGLAQSADLTIVAYTDFGLELMASGKPVIFSADGFGALCDFSVRPRNEDAFFHSLDTNIAAPVSPNPDDVFRFISFVNSEIESEQSDHEVWYDARYRTSMKDIMTLYSGGPKRRSKAVPEKGVQGWNERELYDWLREELLRPTQKRRVEDTGLIIHALDLLPAIEESEMEIIWDQLTHLHPSGDSEKYSLGVLALRLNKFSIAKSLFRELLQNGTSERKAQALYYVAKAERRSGQPMRALYHYAKAFCYLRNILAVWRKFLTRAL